MMVNMVVNGGQKVEIQAGMGFLQELWFPPCVNGCLSWLCQEGHQG